MLRYKLIEEYIIFTIPKPDSGQVNTLLIKNYFRIIEGTITKFLEKMGNISNHSDDLGYIDTMF